MDGDFLKVDGGAGSRLARTLRRGVSTKTSPLRLIRPGGGSWDFRLEVGVFIGLVRIRLQMFCRSSKYWYVNRMLSKTLPYWGCS